MRKYWKDDEITFKMNRSLYRIYGLHVDFNIFYGHSIPYERDKESFMYKLFNRYLK